jgi:hypothetical protein
MITYIPMDSGDWAKTYRSANPAAMAVIPSVKVSINNCLRNRNNSDTPMSKSGWDEVQRTLTYPVDRPGETEQCHPEQGQRRFWDIAASAGMISIDCEAS